MFWNIEKIMYYRALSGAFESFGGSKMHLGLARHEWVKNVLMTFFELDLDMYVSKFRKQTMLP